MRVVSLCPSTTETLFDLGVGDSVVGRTKFCVEPAGAIEAVPVVGGTKDPKIERIVALAPDLVLLNEEENRLEDAEALERAGVATLTTFPRDVPGTAEAVRAIGSAIGRAREARTVAIEIEGALAAARAAAAGCDPVRFACLIWRCPWMAVGAETFTDALLSVAGGTNVFSGPSRYPEFSPDDLAASAPDVVLLTSEPYPFKDEHVAELVDLTGLSADRFRHADGQMLTWHGSRTKSGISYAVELLRLVRQADDS